jgi:TrmH family RNA methyltransferase
MSLSSREQKQLRALHRRKQREESGLFLAEGVRVVEDLLASPLRIRWVATATSLGDTERGRALITSLDRDATVRREVADGDFSALAAREHPQGVIAVAEIPRWSFADLLGAETPVVVLVLDAVQDPGNFGTLVRSAEALGASGVVALPGTVDAWNPKAVRSAAGSSFRRPLDAGARDDASAWVRTQGFHVMAAAVGGDEVPRGLERAALVVGNEGAGISGDVLAGVDRIVGIPLRGRAESLNVTAAAAILLHELTR